MTPEYEKNIITNGRIRKVPGGYVSRRNAIFRYSNDAEKIVCLHEASTSRLTGIPFKYFKCMFDDKTGKVIIGEGAHATTCPETRWLMEILMEHLQDILLQVKNELKNPQLTLPTVVGIPKPVE